MEEPSGFLTYCKVLDTVYLRDATARAKANYRLNVRVHSEDPWQSLCAYNMFIRPKERELTNFTPDWNVNAFPPPS